MTFFCRYPTDNVESERTQYFVIGRDTVRGLCVLNLSAGYINSGKVRAYVSHFFDTDPVIDKETTAVVVESPGATKNSLGEPRAEVDEVYEKAPPLDRTQ